MNFAAFATGLAAGFAILLLRRDLFEVLSARLQNLTTEETMPSNGTAGASPSQCVTLCDECKPTPTVIMQGSAPLSSPAKPNNPPFTWYSVTR